MLDLLHDFFLNHGHLFIEDGPLPQALAPTRLMQALPARCHRDHHEQLYEKRHQRECQPDCQHRLISFIVGQVLFEGVLEDGVGAFVVDEVVDGCSVDSLLQ